MLSPVQLGRIVVISPHIDDGVLCCGDLMDACPGSVVITALAGRPSVYGGLTEWDAASGFLQGDDVVIARRAEDRAALKVLNAKPVWLDFLDIQYNGSPTPEILANGLEQAVFAENPQSVFIPLGIYHPDHKLTHEASLIMLKRRRVSWFFYEDVIYREYPGLLAERLQFLNDAGLQLQSVEIALAHASERKRRAVDCYPTQLKALSTPPRPGYADVFNPEGYWKATKGLGNIGA